MFSESWWIGTKEENPEEARLDFPKELAQVDTFHLFYIFSLSLVVATEMFNMIRELFGFRQSKQSLISKVVQEEQLRSRGW